jgi:hypothetical protein
VSSRPESESPEGKASFCAKEDYCSKGYPAYNISSVERKYIKSREGFTRIVINSASERTASSKLTVISYKKYTAGSKRRVVRYVRPIRIIRSPNIRVDSHITVAETDSLFLR